MRKTSKRRNCGYSRDNGHSRNDSKGVRKLATVGTETTVREPANSE